MKLDDIQQKIVDCDANNIIVSAGAGSGKTLVLTERVKRLLLEGEEPHNLVVITFTNMAAEEMRERLKNVKGIGDAFVGTIHSFANKLMQLSGEKYDIYTDEKENQLAREIIKKYCKHITFDRFLEYKDVRFNVEMGLLDEDVLGEVLLPSEAEEYRILFGKPIEDYKETIPTLCKKYGVITFDELLEKATEYFASINGEVEHVLVDELQDIGYLEYKFIRGLNAKNYFFVGDDWQAIYGFKGGNVGIFINLMNDKNWTRFVMSRNYRNKTEIIKYAQKVISQSGDIINKKVEPVQTQAGSVEIHSRYLIDDVLQNIPPGQYRDLFILTRTNRQVFEIVEKLKKLKIPFSCFKMGAISHKALKAELAKDTVKVLTVHTAKGLESKNVILYGDFPIHQPSYLRESEERKVMYVGMTRAIDKLIILN